VENVIRSLCEWKGIEVMELNGREDHVQAVLEIAPRRSVSEAMGVRKDLKLSFQFLSCA
jgi:putative transposase